MASAACRETGDVEVTSITFRGANAVKADELKSVLATRESGFLPWSRKRFFDRPEFDRDVQRIEAFYADRGFPKAKVVNVDVALNDTQDKVAITVEVNGHELTLSGSVRSSTERDQAEHVAWAAAGVGNVKNNLSITS